MRLRAIGGIVTGVLCVALLQTVAAASKPRPSVLPDAAIAASSEPFPTLQVTAWRPADVRLTPTAAGPIVPKDQALIPLPPATWTGLTGLALMGILLSRKSIFRFVTT